MHYKTFKDTDNLGDFEYVGEGKDIDGKTIRHGHGLSKWNTGQQYEGNWKKDAMHGFGRFTEKNGSYYEAKFNKGVPKEPEYFD